jgi:diguanylate cyclase (GGDEF)-like protein
MSNVDSAATRILAPLSALLQKPLTIDDASSPAFGAEVIHLPSSDRMLRCADGRAFTDVEREFVYTVFELIRTGAECDSRIRDLEQRMQSLRHENLELVVQNRVLSEVSSRDSLTGLYNRWYVLEKIDVEINRSVRHGSPMSVLMLDIDHFKRVNDSFGHSAGDEVLRSVGQVLRESCRVYDVPGRYGGEEFCIVLPETRVGNTTTVAERIRRRLATAVMAVGETSVTVTASIGIAGMDCVPEEGVLSSTDLIDRADRALYSAKHRGRNRIEMWESPLNPSPSESVSH